MALPNAKILIHQLWGGFEGQAADIEIHAREAIALKRRMEEIIAHHTGQPLEAVSKDMERDYFMTAEEAKAYGIIDTVIANRNRDSRPPLPDRTDRRQSGSRGVSLLRRPGRPLPARVRAGARNRRRACPN
jgi:ClpP protease-like protein